jgi:hypothetical protein
MKITMQNKVIFQVDILHRKESFKQNHSLFYHKSFQKVSIIYVKTKHIY